MKQRAELNLHSTMPTVRKQLPYPTAKRVVPQGAQLDSLPDLVVTQIRKPDSTHLFLTLAKD